MPTYHFYLTFNMSSVFNNYTEVVELMPVEAISAADLKTNLLQIIKRVRSTSFTVLVVIANNCADNRRVYNGLYAVDKYSFDNARHAGKPILLLLDCEFVEMCLAQLAEPKRYRPDTYIPFIH